MPKASMMISIVTIVLSTWLSVSVADEKEADFRVRNAQTRVVDEVYRLEANIDFVLSAVMQDALSNGVTLLLEIQIKVVHERAWIWDENIAELSIKYRLNYHALSERYLITNVNNGLQQNFRQLDDALAYIGKVRDFPMLDQRLLLVGNFYVAQIRAVLDAESLPTPMKLQSYMSPKWNLSNEWYSWPLQP